MTKQEVLALAERVEKSEGSDRELDAEIWAISERLSGFVIDAIPSENCVGMVTRYFESGTHGTAVSPSYTFSLDAAMSLVPEGHFPRLFCEAAFAIIVRYEVGDPWVEVCRSGLCLTPALALTAAALRAIAEGMKNDAAS